MKNDCSSAPADSQERERDVAPVTPVHVTVIPATRGLDRSGAQLKNRMGGLRVAAYCRVSTGDESQQTSYINQVNYYTGLIRSRINWTFAGVYADEGLSGTSTARRVNFNRMVEDARNGQIDYIITKSVSRFARNTVITLSLVRELRNREQPVGIFFEKEHIDSLDPTGELLLAIMSALAQEESESISRNIRWSLQKKQKAGIPQVNLARMLGYDKGENGTWVINEGQARTVREIFRQYLGGISANSIAQELNASGMVTVTGKKWTASTVIRILRNEKYAGDLLMQKTFTEDVISQRPIVNHGQMPRFYIMDHHAPIIPRDDWNRAQLLLDGKEWNPGYPGKGTEDGAPASCTKNARGRSAHVFRNLTVFGGMDSGKDGGIPLRRCMYRSFVNLDAVGMNPETDGNHKGSTRYSYSVPMWMTGDRSERQLTADKEGERRKTGKFIPHALFECALEQSFMEMLYACRWDWLRNREDSLIENQFSIFFRDMEKTSSGQKECDAEMKLIGEQISWILSETETLNARIRGISFTGGGSPDREEYAALCGKRETYRQRLAALKSREEKLKANVLRPQLYRSCHEKFLRYLERLPDVNAAGMPLSVSGICSPEQAFDLLTFDRAAYSAFIQNGTVYGDIVEYETNFGVKLISSGNARTLADFIGFRRCRADGTAELLDQAWKVNRLPLRPAKKRRRKKKLPEICRETGDPAAKGKECAL